VERRRDAGELRRVGAGRHPREVDDEASREVGRQGAAAGEEAIRGAALRDDREVQVDDGERAIAVDLARRRLRRELEPQQVDLEQQLRPVPGLGEQARLPRRRALVETGQDEGGGGAVPVLHHAQLTRRLHLSRFRLRRRSTPSTASSA
jgi:hypothetical protein